MFPSDLENPVKNKKLRRPFLWMVESEGAESGAGSESAATSDGEEALGEAGKKALQAERDARKHAEQSAKDLKAQLDAIEAEKLSDLEKVQKSLAESQAATASFQSQALRYKYAAEHGIPAEHAERFISGTTEEEVKAQAESLAALLNSGGNAPPTPRPDLSQGGSGTPPVPPDGKDAPDMNDALRAVRNRK